MTDSVSEPSGSFAIHVFTLEVRRRFRAKVYLGFRAFGGWFKVGAFVLGVEGPDCQDSCHKHPGLIVEIQVELFLIY